MVPKELVETAANKLAQDYERRVRVGDLAQPLGVAAEYPLFLEIQTHTACNAACVCCPHPVVVKELPNGFISEQLWEKVLQEAATLPIKRFIPYLNNEPFLDPQFVRRLRQIREYVPHAFIEVSTNASRLSKEIARSLIDEHLIDDLRISFFGVDQETYSKRMPGLQWLETMRNVSTLLQMNQAADTALSITMIGIDDNEIAVESWDKAEEKWKEMGAGLRVWGYLDRAGNNERKNEMIFKGDFKLRGCELNRPFERLCMLYNGDVILCSQDWRREEIQGNVLRDGIQGVWNSETFKTLREHMLGNGAAVDLCTKCKLALLDVDGTVIPRSCSA